MSSSSNNASDGSGLLMVLFVVFLVLKLTETIDWSWWWVTAPLWIPPAFVAALFLVGYVLVVIGRNLKRLAR